MRYGYSSYQLKSNTWHKAISKPGKTSLAKNNSSLRLAW